MPIPWRWLLVLMACTPLQAGDGMAAAHERLQAWRAFKPQLETLDERTRVEAVNRFFNRIVAYGKDSEAWGRPDYWATPMETLRRGAGDCEDYAIAKYFALQAIGIPASRLRLFYVRLHPGQAGGAWSKEHVVLGYYPLDETEPLILDNLIATLYPAPQRTDLAVLFSFDRDSVEFDDARHPLEALPPWLALLLRMQTQDGLS